MIMAKPIHTSLTQLDAIRLVCKYLEERAFLITHSPLNNKKVNNILATFKDSRVKTPGML